MHTAAPLPMASVAVVPPRPPATRSCAPRADVGTRVLVLNLDAFGCRLVGRYYPGTVMEELFDGRVRIDFDDGQVSWHDLNGGREAWMPLHEGAVLPSQRDAALALDNLQRDYAASALAREGVERQLLAARLQAERDLGAARALSQLQHYAPRAPVPDPNLSPFIFTLPSSGLHVVAPPSCLKARACHAAVLFAEALLKLHSEELSRRSPELVEQDIAARAATDDSEVEAIFNECGLYLIPMKPGGFGGQLLTQRTLELLRPVRWQVSKDGRRLGSRCVLVGGPGFEDVTVVGAFAERCGPEASMSCSSLILTRMGQPRKHVLGTAIDLGECVEIITNSPDLVRVGIHARFAWHCHGNSMPAADDLVGSEQLVLVPFAETRAVNNERRLVEFPAMMRDEVSDVTAGDRALIDVWPPPPEGGGDIMAAALADCCDEAAALGYETHDIAGDSFSFALGNRLRPKPNGLEEPASMVLLPDAEKIALGIDNLDHWAPRRRAAEMDAPDDALARMSACAAPLMGDFAADFDAVAPHATASLIAAMGDSAAVYPPREKQLNGRQAAAGGHGYWATPSLVVRLKGSHRHNLTTDGALDVLRRLVCAHTDDADADGVLLYHRVLPMELGVEVGEGAEGVEGAEGEGEGDGAEGEGGEGAGTLDTSSLASMVESATRNLKLHLRLRGGRSAAVWVPYHRRPARFRPRANWGRQARVNALQRWRAAGAPLQAQ